METGQGASATARIASAFRQLSRRQVSPAQTGKELTWQQRAGPTSTVSDRFRDEVLAGGPQLHILVYMTEESPFLQVMHSIARFFDIEAGVDVNNKTFGFVGDRTQYREPYPVILPVQNAWRWGEVTVCLERDKAKSFYEGATTTKMCWVPGDDALRQSVYLPRLLYLPSVLGRFMVNEKCTPWELLGEVERLIADNTAGITVENSELIREWCLAAGQTTTQTRCTPAVVLKVNAVHSDDERFAYWAYHRLSATLG